MKPEKLLKLLGEAETRSARLEKAIGAYDGRSSLTFEITQRLSNLRANLRRHQSKIDTLRLHDVGVLEQSVDELREIVLEQIRTIQPNDPIWSALKSLYDDTVLKHFTGGLRIGLNQLEPEELIEQVPGQKLAAFKFEFVDDELRVVDQPLRADDREKETAFAALESAMEQGELVVADLNLTNASPRLKEAFGRLQTTMASHKNIVQVGSRAQMCGRLVQAEAEELSPTLFGFLLGHIETVFSALAQFRDWREYCENASGVPLDRQSIDELMRGAGAMINQIRLAGVTHPSVVEAVETATAWVDEPAMPDKRDVFSLTRTIENLWSATLKSMIGLGRDTASEARKAAAKVILVALLATGASIVPIIAKVPGGEWVETVFKYLKSVGVDSAKK